MKELIIGLIVYQIILTIWLIVQFSQTAICPVTGKKDFKKNMFAHTFHYGVGQNMSFSTSYYTKEGYEKNFDCKILNCRRDRKNHRVVPNNIGVKK